MCAKNFQIYLNRCFYYIFAIWQLPKNSTKYCQKPYFPWHDYTKTTHGFQQELGKIFSNIRDSRIANRELKRYTNNIFGEINMKPQDIVIALKLISKSAKSEIWTQHEIAVELCMSPSEINAGLKRLQESGLLLPVTSLLQIHHPKINKTLLLEFLLHGIRYVFPAKPGVLTRGIVTSYAAPAFKNKIAIGNDPIPVWPYAEGNARGLAITPLYKSVPSSIALYPEQPFYDMLTLVDAIRCGMARERKIAADLLTKILKGNQ